MKNEKPDILKIIICFFVLLCILFGCSEEQSDFPLKRDEKLWNHLVKVREDTNLARRERELKKLIGREFKFCGTLIHATKERVEYSEEAGVYVPTDKMIISMYVSRIVKKFGRRIERSTATDS